ncbi:Rieske 2Fe-2S domain-containing protein [Pseudomonas aeruginosa]|nr:Rieske 2Fe-2S domain-containing protein [Pseudomonas aeruginosa]
MRWTQRTTPSHRAAAGARRLFGRLWIFVGFRTSGARAAAVLHPQDRRADRGATCRSGIRAFLNQCPHRLSAIQTECTDQRPLVTAYHAWSFGAEGQLQGIPNSSLYQFSAEERARIGLRKLHLEEVGQLLFVNLADDPLPLLGAVRRWIPGNLAGDAPRTWIRG